MVRKSVLAWMCLLAAGWCRAAAVVETEREIPVWQDVDVVVVGGSCGAVAAAQAAAQAGAKVFLAAPRPYLGEDLAGCLRLWLDEGENPESPLARSIYISNEASLPFTYKTDAPSGGKHKDNGGMLCDGLSDDVQHHTVEFAGDVAITADLGGVQAVDSVELIAFKRAGDFETGSVHMSVSADGRKWSPPIPLTMQPAGDIPNKILYVAALDRSVCMVKVAVKIKPGAKRQLISELTLKAKGAGVAVITPTPLRVKRSLDQALLERGVSYLTGAYATDVLRDAKGNPAGIVMANRSGRQAVLARVIIDATERATVARLAGASFAPYPAGPQRFTRVVIAGAAPAADGMTVQPLPGTYEAPVTMGGYKVKGERVPGRAYACTLTIPMREGSYRAFAEAEQVARDRTFVPSLLEGADTLFQIPPDPMKAAAPLAGAWPGAAKVDLGCFRPAGVPRLYVLGGCADMSREAAERLLRPLALMAVGERVGAAAASEARSLPRPAGVSLKGKAEAAVAAGEVRESLNGPRPFLSGLPTVPSARTALPVLGEYDVVVVGGGTAGAPAGIGAGRQGAKTLVIEYLYGLGGVGTLGMIGKYWYGNACGFTAEHDKGVADLGAAVHIVGKSEWWRRENRKAGTEIWFGVMGCGALVQDGRVTGVVVATPFGRGVVRAKSVVDATGNAEVAAAAGAPCVFVGAEELAVQGTGLSPRKLGASYINSDFGYVNDCDAADLWLFGVRGRAGAGNAWDVSQIVESRERQRIVGDCWVTPLDILNGRTFPDTIAQARSNFDSHGYSVAEICYVSEPTAEKGPNARSIFSANVPYRALLPQGVEGLAVVGIGISAHRDAMPIMRMQPDVQNMGYVAGVAGATAAREGKTFRAIDVKALQRHLVDIGNLPKEVLEWRDNAFVDAERLAVAVKELGSHYKGVSLVLAQWAQAQPLMRQAYATAHTLSERLVYAHVLGIMGDAAGVETLAEVVSGKQPGLGLSLGGEHAFGRRMSETDSLIVALGRTKDPRALAPLLAEVAKLDASSAFGRIRAVTLALEALGDPAAARPLAALLAKPGIAGHAKINVTDISPAGGYGGVSGNERTLCLRELAVARALFRCGDCDGAAERVLREYAKDLRGVYALHATEVLKRQ
ncbi:MAG TPA: FAD-dependent oxidoreductase [Kiritimatiellia bacterium]|nr:FAD-dependent oxidoreductase [Kiritimatiellia bacterium]HRU70384.1 FAD-dependent oxidoreductase [Kiritimatiellia bacterium]